MIASRLPLVLLALVACNKADPVATTAPTKAVEASKNSDLTAHTWAGKVHSSAGTLKFKEAGGALTATMAYQLFGRVIITDEFTVTRGADGTVTLTGSPKNKLIGGNRFPLAELKGALSDDKATIAGTHTIPQGEIKWFITTKQTVAELDPPLDVAAGEKALLATGWEGTVGDKPSKLTFSKKGDALTAMLSSGKDKTTLDASVDATGLVRLTSAPKPTSGGLLTRTFAGHFGTNELARFAGTEESLVKQGFVEQSNSAAFVFAHAAAPAPKGKKK